MNNQNTDALDMFAELFIPPRVPREYLLPPKSEEEYLEDLEQGTDLAAKTEALLALIHIFRAKTMKTGQKYTEEIAGGIVGIFKRHASGPELSGQTAQKLMLEGSNCEWVGDYQGSVWFYKACLEFKTNDRGLSFYRLNNLGFCLNFIKKFKEAEAYLHTANELMPKKYNAWKNLGVSLEHQGITEETAKCYMRAINMSNAEKRSVKHLMRLIARHPELNALPEVQGYLDSLAKHGIIPKPAQA